MKVLGIDPGSAAGGLAIVDVPEPFRHAILLDAIDIPLKDDRVNPIVVLNWLRRHGPERAFIERAGLFPGQNIAAGAKFMRAVGYLEATVILARVPLEIVEASSWKRRYGLPGGFAAGKVSIAKEAARQKAIQVFGSDAMLDLKSHHGRAEAALIALYGAEKHGVGNAGPAEGELPLHPGGPAMAV